MIKQWAIVWSMEQNSVKTLLCPFIHTRQLLKPLVSQVVLAPNVGHKDKQEPLWLLGQISKVKIYH